MGPVAPWHVGSSQTRARTRVPCIGRQILNHCATREALEVVLIPILQRRKLKLRKRSDSSHVPGLEKILNPGLFDSKAHMLTPTSKSGRILVHATVSCSPHPRNVSTVVSSHLTQLGKRASSLGLPWWRSGYESACQCRGHGFEPWSGKIPHAAEQLSPCATTTEPAL